jgi:hypothetical protein
MEKLVAALDKVKTPLTLGGLVVIVLYGLYSQVLKLFGPNSFPSGSAPIIVREIVGYVFWLAIVAVVLGIVAWVVVRYSSAKDPDAPIALKPVRKQRKPKPPANGNEP